MPKKKLTQKRLKKIFHYNPTTGVWIYNIKYISRGRKSLRYGKFAGYISKSTGYYILGIDNKAYQSSRLAFLYMDGYIPENQVDHINRIRHDDRWCNLRHVSCSCNIRNVGIRKNNTTGITGVYWHKRRKAWTVCIHEDNKKINATGDNFFDAVVKRFELEKKYNYHSCISDSTAYLYLKKKGYFERNNTKNRAI